MFPIKGTKYLSELVQMNLLQKNKLNIIKAPTGSGKTYFALTALPSTVEKPDRKIVYLIDTINGKQQILQNYNAKPIYSCWVSDVQDCDIEIRFDDDEMYETDRRVVIITYAKFGSLLIQNPDFYQHFEYIICDELHSLMKYQYFEKAPNLCSIARLGLEMAVRNENTTVVALTATPAQVKVGFDAPFAEMPIDQTVIRQFETKEVIRYTNLEYLLSILNPNEKGVCFVSHIRQMKKLEAIAREKGFKTTSFWSISNADHPMTQAQLDAREAILNTFTIPEEYNLLIINASSETSLKIKSHVDYMIVHSYENDTRVQVRGRVNSDLDRLYLPSKDPSALSVPDGFLNRPLFTADKSQLCSTLNIHNPQGRLCKWTTIHRNLLSAGYAVKEGRKGNDRYVILKSPDEKA